MDTSTPFRTRDAGAPTRGRLAGPRYQPVFRGAHVEAAVPADLVLRARAASLLVPGAVVGGHAAAELLGASCGPLGAAVDLIVGRRRLRHRPGLRVRQDVLDDDEVVEVDGLRVTSFRRTAFDLARRLDRVEAVVAVDALAHVGRFDPAELLAYPLPRPRARGARRLRAAVAAADRRAESPPETRTRLGLIAHGVPVPELQIEVVDPRGIPAGRVDMGWRRARVGVEYLGDHHRTERRRWRRDQRRLADLAAAGWLIIPATGDTLRRPDVLAEQVLTALASHSR